MYFLLKTFYVTYSVSFSFITQTTIISSLHQSMNIIITWCIFTLLLFYLITITMNIQFSVYLSMVSHLSKQTSFSTHIKMREEKNRSSEVEGVFNNVKQTILDPLFSRYNTFICQPLERIISRDDMFSCYT